MLLVTTGFSQSELIIYAKLKFVNDINSFQRESKHHLVDIEEGVSYVAGNMLWAVYKFTVFIVLLSILRARMVNTYHRIFKEADIQWKFFRLN